MIPPTINAIIIPKISIFQSGDGVDCVGAGVGVGVGVGVGLKTVLETVKDFSRDTAFKIDVEPSYVACNR